MGAIGPYILRWTDLPAFQRNMGQPKDEILSGWIMKKSPEEKPDKETKKDKNRERQRWGQSKWDLDTDVHETRRTFHWKLGIEGVENEHSHSLAWFSHHNLRTLMTEEVSSMSYVLYFSYDLIFFPLSLFHLIFICSSSLWPLSSQLP